MFFLFPTTVFGQINVKIKDRVLNIDDGDGHGYCAWACLETAGRHMKVKKMIGLLSARSKESDHKEWDEENKRWIHYVNVYYGTTLKRERRNVGTDWAIYRKLESMKISFQMQPTYKYDTTMIRNAMKNNQPCVFAVMQGAWGYENGVPSEAHAMLLVYFDDKKIEYIDPNCPCDSKGKPVCYEASRAWFDRWWSGLTVVIEKQ